MKVEKIRVTVGHTGNIGNYESVRAEVSLEAILEPNDSVTEVRKQLNMQAQEELEKVLHNLTLQYRA